MRGRPLTLVACLACLTPLAQAGERPPRTARDAHWIWTNAHLLPAEAVRGRGEDLWIDEGKNGRVEIVVLSSGANASRVEFDPTTGAMKVVGDATGLERRPKGAGPLAGTPRPDDPKGPPVRWEVAVSPDHETLYAADPNGNRLFAHDLTTEGKPLPGRDLGPLVPGAEAVECRALCVGPDGLVWAGVAATFPKGGRSLHVVRHRPGDDAPRDLGPIAIGDPDTLTNPEKLDRLDDGTLVPRDAITAIHAARDGAVYLTTANPPTLHALRIPKVAGITTEYILSSHADVLLSRLVQTETLDGQGRRPPLDLVSLHVDQVPENDISRRLASEHGFAIHDDTQGALTRGRDKLNVDGVFLIAEFGAYPRSDTDQILYPKRRLFQELLDVLDRSGRVVPVFFDKHLADNWTDAKWIYDQARNRGIPMMAGSSLPGTWRYPPTDVKRGAKLREIVVVSYGALDAYGFHGLEVAQCLAERRAGGETGIQSALCLEGETVWKAGREGLFDRALLDAALGRLKDHPLPPGKRIEDLVPRPVLYQLDYNDGLRVSVLTLNPAVAEWSAAWRYEEDDSIDSTLFWAQPTRPFAHFNLLLKGIERLMFTGRPTWPVERTLLTSGALDAVLTSRRDGGHRVETPWLNVTYTSEWNWTEPPPPPPSQRANRR